MSHAVLHPPSRTPIHCCRSRSIVSAFAFRSLHNLSRAFFRFTTELAITRFTCVLALAICSRASVLGMHARGSKSDRSRKGSRKAGFVQSGLL